MKVLIVHKNRTFNLSNLKTEFPELNIKSVWKNILKQDHLNNVDLIISIGGDGTFLSAAHYAKKELLLGVNSNEKKSEGALTTTNLEKLPQKIRHILSGNYKVKEYTREEIKICEATKCIKTELALNEAFFGNINPHHTANYKINYKNKTEKQKSSGVLISTGTGSTAWYKTIGGFSFSRTKKQLRFRVRELYKRRLHRPTIYKGKIKNKEFLKIIVTKKHCFIAIDSIRTYPLEVGNHIEISLGEPLRVVQ